MFVVASLNHLNDGIGNLFNTYLNLNYYVIFCRANLLIFFLTNIYFCNCQQSVTNNSIRDNLRLGFVLIKTNPAGIVVSAIAIEPSGLYLLYIA